MISYFFHSLSVTFEVKHQIAEFLTLLPMLENLINLYPTFFRYFIKVFDVLLIRLRMYTLDYKVIRFEEATILY